MAYFDFIFIVHIDPRYKGGINLVKNQANVLVRLYRLKVHRLFHFYDYFLVNYNIMLINSYHNNYITLDHMLNFSKNSTRPVTPFHHPLKPVENIIVSDQYKVHPKLVGTNSSPLEHRTNCNVFDTPKKVIYLDNYLNYSNSQDLLGCIASRHKSYYIGFG